MSQSKNQFFRIVIFFLVLFQCGLALGIPAVLAATNIGTSIATDGYIKAGDGYLVYLGSKADPDPTGVNGAAYYNTTNNKFRCYESGSWKDCITTVAAATLQTSYNNGATITTAGSTDIAFSLASGDFNVSGAGAVNLTPSGTLTLTAGAPSTWSTSAGVLTVDSAAALNLGTTSATAVSIGKSGITVTTNGDFDVLGNTTLGDAAGDTLTFNASTLSIPNNLNIDSDTLFVDSTANNIGIGTNSPGAKLEVTDSIRSLSTLGPVVPTTGKGIEISYDGRVGYDKGYIYAVDRSGDISQKLSIIANPLLLNEKGDNVGIGTIAPGSALDVKGTLRLSGSTSGYVGFTPAAVAGSTTYTLPSTDGTTGQVLSTNGSGTLSWIAASGSDITSVGDVASGAAFDGTQGTTLTFNNAGGDGILSYDGTDFDLDKPATIATSLTSPTIIGGTATTSALNLKTTSGIGAAGADMHFLVGNNGATEAMTILNDGSVGIGTTGPSEQLDVRGTLLAGNSNENGTGVLITNTTIKPVNIPGGADLFSADLHLDSMRGAGAGHVILAESGGRVGIGDTTPDTLLDLLSAAAAITQLTITNTNAGDVDAQIGLQFTEGTNLFTLGVDDSDSDKFKISTTALGTADRLTIDSVGNVGIGTTSPDFLLDVAGNLRLESANRLYFGGTGAGDTLGNLYHDGTDFVLSDDLKAAGYKSSDGSSGLTSTITVRASGGLADCTLTVKNGLITATTCP
jgi:hypothetical protein